MSIRCAQIKYLKNKEKTFSFLFNRYLIDNLYFDCHLFYLSFHFFVGWYEDNWFEVNLEKENITCTKEEMKMAAEGHLTTEALMWNQNAEEKTISGMSSGQFR